MHGLAGRPPRSRSEREEHAADDDEDRDRALDTALAEARSAVASADETRLLTFRADAHRTLAAVLARAEDEARFMSEAREALRLYEAKGNAASAAAMVASLEARSRS